MNRKQLLAIEKYAFRRTSKSLDDLHNFAHVRRVSKNALNIIKILGLEAKIDKNLLQAICFLHDLTYSEHDSSLKTYFQERLLVKKELQKAFAAFKIKNNEKKIITKAAVSHSHSFPFRRLNKKGDLYTKVLQDADTLDCFSKQRYENFLRQKKKQSFYKVYQLLLNMVFKFGRKNLTWFLNFPQLKEKLYV